MPKAAPGDDKVYKFVGDPGEGNPGVEASLDIQYIMGVVSRCIYIYITYHIFPLQSFSFLPENRIIIHIYISNNILFILLFTFF